MYLYWFERIVRKYSGMYDWAIPFWDWANPAQRQLPPAFRTVGSALHDPSRNAAMNNGTGSVSTALGTAVTNAYLLLDYFTAQSAINGPHGGVHGAVSGNMCCVPTAAQDPIFWAHHANVDRQWNLWIAQGGGRSNPRRQCGVAERDLHFLRRMLPAGENDQLPGPARGQAAQLRL